MQIPGGHVEVRLRIYDIYSPYPEEFNRQPVGIVANYNFVPAEISKQILLNEGKSPTTIFVTGIIAIDALRTIVTTDYSHEQLDGVADRRHVMIIAQRRDTLVNQ